MLKKDLLGLHHADALWELLKHALTNDVTWLDTWPPEAELHFKDLLNRALNTLGGECVDTLLDLARWHHRSLANVKNSLSDSEHLRLVVWDRLFPLLQVCLDRKASDTQGIAVVIGDELPFLWFLAPRWIEENLGDLLADGIENPDKDPLWGAYLVQGRVYSDLFRVLRPWYVKALTGAIGNDAFREKDEWSLTQFLGQHVLCMALAGQCGLGDPDQVVEMSFKAMSIKERTHCYWWVSQGWPHEVPEHQEIFCRVAISVWEWRLQELEAAPLAPESLSEAAGLMWMIRTPDIPSREVIRLGLRTQALPHGEDHSRGLFWERLTEIAPVEPRGAFALVEQMILSELRAGSPFLPFEDLSPLFKTFLHSGDPELANRATVLLNQLGERGLLEYGELLS